MGSSPDSPAGQQKGPTRSLSPPRLQPDTFTASGHPRAAAAAAAAAAAEGLMDGDPTRPRGPAPAAPLPPPPPPPPSGALRAGPGSEARATAQSGQSGTRAVSAPPPPPALPLLLSRQRDQTLRLSSSLRASIRIKWARSTVDTQAPDYLTVSRQYTESPLSLLS